MNDFSSIQEKQIPEHAHSLHIIFKGLITLPYARLGS